MSKQKVLTLVSVQSTACTTDVWSLCTIVFLYLYQDVHVGWKDFEPAIATIGSSQHFTVSSNHGRAFIPQTMVELDEPIRGSDISTISTACTTDQLKEAGVDFEDSRCATLEHEKQKAVAALAKDLGPEVAGQTNIKGPIPQLGVGSTVMIPNLTPPIYGIIVWIGTIPQVQGYVAGVELVKLHINL